MIAKKQANRPAKPRVYSYTRFSTPEQKQGDSQRRQDEDAKQWAAKRGYQFDESLKDEGLSGYHGANRKRGALGAFLARINAGAVPRGSVLVVENIDRLGREDFFDAFETIGTILRHEITIVTLSPCYEEYTRESVTGGKVWQLVGQIQNAHEESKKKSKRVKEAREAGRNAARESGRIFTKALPAWLRVNDQEKLVAIPEAAKTIQMIFDLKSKGIGKLTIERKLNAEAPWTPPQRKGRGKAGWRASYIQKILGNRAVIGEYQPHVLEGGRGGVRKPDGDPIPNYYPIIVEPAMFYGVQAAREGNRGKGGRTGKARNLLVHLAHCAYCGGPMAYVAKGPRWVYLACDSGRRGAGCKSHSVAYQECEDTLLENCQRLRPEQVLPNPDEQAAACQAMRQRLAGIDGEITDIEAQLDNLTDQVAATKSQAMRNRYEAKMAALVDRQTVLEADKAAAHRDLSAAETGLQSFKTWQRGFAALREALAGGDVEVRLRLRSHLREFIDRVEVFAVGHPTRYDPESRPAGRNRLKDRRCGDDLADYIESIAGEFAPELMKDKRFHAFIEDVMRRRMSKEGRFLRVYYKTGARVDIVPAGSMACGMALYRGRGGGWRFVSPDIDRLWRKFSAHRDGKAPRAMQATRRRDD